MVIIIQEYPFKRGFSQEMSRIKTLLEKNFPAAIKEDGGKYTLNYGAFSRLTVWLDNKKLCVDTESNRGAKDEMVLETNKRYRVFLEEAIGYSAKERLAKAKKEVQG